MNSFSISFFYFYMKNIFELTPGSPALHTLKIFCIPTIDTITEMKIEIFLESKTQNQPTE